MHMRRTDKRIQATTQNWQQRRTDSNTEIRKQRRTGNNEEQAIEEQATEKNGHWK